MSGIYKLGFLIVAAFILAISFSYSASGAMYQYVDEKGRVHLTNKESNILPQYMDSAKVIESRENTASSVDKKSFAGEKESVWLEYKQMSWFQKKALVARAGFTDMKSVLNDLKIKMGIILAFFIALGVYASIKLPKVSHKITVISLLVLCYGQVYLALHISSVMGQGDDILSNLKQMKSITQPSAGIRSPVSSSQNVFSSSPTTPGSDISAQKELLSGSGGIMESLKELQSLSNERQELFKMILDEDRI